MSMGRQVAAGALLVWWVTQALGQNDDGAFTRVHRSTDTAWLARIAGSLEEAAKLIPPDDLAAAAKSLRTTAYARLGELATPESLGEIDKLERDARQIKPATQAVRVGEWTHPAWHFEDRPFDARLQVSLADGLTYALVGGSWLDGADLFVATSASPGKGTWSRPRLVAELGHWPLAPARTAAGADRLRCDYLREWWEDDAARPYHPRRKTEALSVTISLPEVLRDGDGDG